MNKPQDKEIRDFRNINNGYLRLSDIFTINQQSGKLRIILFIAIYMVIWFLLALIIFSTNPESNNWLIELFGPPKNLLTGIIYDFLANVFSLPLILLLFFTVLLYKVSLNLAGYFFAKLFESSNRKAIEKHLTRCLFSIPNFPRITLDCDFYENQNEENFFSTIGGPAFISTREKSILVIEKGWRNVVTFIEELSDNNEYFLENKSRLVDFFPISNNVKFKMISGQSNDRMDFGLFNLELKYHVRVIKTNSLNKRSFPKIFTDYSSQNTIGKGFTTYLRILFYAFSISFLRNIPSTTFMRIISQTSDDTSKRPKINLRKINIQKQKIINIQMSKNFYREHYFLHRNRNLGMYPFLRKVEDTPSSLHTFPENVDELGRQMGKHIEVLLENYFGRKIIHVDNIYIKEIKNVIK